MKHLFISVLFYITTSQVACQTAGIQPIQILNPIMLVQFPVQPLSTPGIVMNGGVSMVDMPGYPQQRNFFACTPAANHWAYAVELNQTRLSALSVTDFYFQGGFKLLTLPTSTLVTSIGIGVQHVKIDFTELQRLHSGDLMFNFNSYRPQTRGTVAYLSQHYWIVFKASDVLKEPFVFRDEQSVLYYTFKPIPSYGFIVLKRILTKKSVYSVGLAVSGIQGIPMNFKGIFTVEWPSRFKMIATLHFKGSIESGMQLKCNSNLSLMYVWQYNLTRQFAQNWHNVGICWQFNKASEIKNESNTNLSENTNFLELELALLNQRVDSLKAVNYYTRYTKDTLYNNIVLWDTVHRVYFDTVYESKSSLQENIATTHYRNSQQLVADTILIPRFCVVMGVYQNKLAAEKYRQWLQNRLHQTVVLIQHGNNQPYLITIHNDTNEKDAVRHWREVIEQVNNSSIKLTHGKPWIYRRR